jgi:hypothetical protein
MLGSRVYNIRFCWLQDELPKLFPRVRVLSYNYRGGPYTAADALLADIIADNRQNGIFICLLV